MVGEAVKDIEAAWDELAEQEEKEAPEQEAPEAEAEEPIAGAEEADLVEPESAEEEPSGEEPTGEGEEATEAATEADVSPAPVSWGAATREYWKDLPQQVQQEIIKRERDFAVGIQKHAENARRAEQMDQVLAPYQQYFALSGGSPGQTIQSLLQTGAILQMGNPQQRAQAAANIIKQFGVDIPTLDALLVGEQPPEGQAPQPASVDIHNAVQQAVAPYQQFMAQFQQHQQFQQDQLQEESSQELAAFANDPKNEFYNDVCLDMADILEVSANQGREMSLAEAYKIACSMRPDITKVIQTREAANKLRIKEQAAASISGSPAAPETAPEPTDTRSQLEAAWDQHSR